MNLSNYYVAFVVFGFVMAILSAIHETIKKSNKRYWDIKDKSPYYEIRKDWTEKDLARYNRTRYVKLVDIGDEKVIYANEKGNYYLDKGSFKQNYEKVTCPVYIKQIKWILGVNDEH